MAAVRTVSGDVEPSSLGAVNYHEHFFQASPLLPGDELDDEDASTAEAVTVRRHGIEAVVDATPIGLGRQPAALARLSTTAELHVVAATGVHRPAHYGSGHWLDGLDEVALGELFVGDLTLGCPVSDGPEAASDGAPRTAVQAGLIKLGLDYWSIPPFVRRAVAAAGTAHRQTGAPVMVHLERCTAGHEVLDLLADEGVAAHHVALAHVDRVPDPGLHVSLAERGAYLGYDGCARYSAVPESTLLVCLAKVVEVAADRVLLGGDVARASRFSAYGGMPGMSYLSTRYLPRVRAAVGDAVADRLLRDNPAAWLTWS